MDGSRSPAAWLGPASRWRTFSVLLLAAACIGCSNGPGRTSTAEPAHGAPGHSVAMVEPELPHNGAELQSLCSCDGRYGPAAPTLDPAVLPVDVSLKDNQSCLATSCQPCFACYAWQLLIALSWPSQADGTAARHSSFGTPGDRTPLVWEQFRDVDTIFEHRTPDKWQPPSVTAKTLRPIAKLRATEQADQLWLTDRNGGLVRYEIRINRDGFEYIVHNDLYHQAGLLRAFQSGSGVDFPAQKSRYGPHGVIEIKAAWVMVPAGEEERMTASYKVAEVILPKEQSTRLAALVGLHIAKKTPNSPQWVWATFEHRDNAPDSADAGQHDQRHYSFYDPALPADWTPNQDQPPDPYASPPTPQNRPVQLVRQTPIDKRYIMPINHAVQALIAARYPNSVWQNYQLVGVQWPQNPVPQYSRLAPLPTGLPAPAALANLTMESYMQKPGRGGGSPDGTSSCIGCHANAAITPTFDPALFTSKAPIGGKAAVFGWTDYSAIFARARYWPVIKP